MQGIGLPQGLTTSSHLPHQLHAQVSPPSSPSASPNYLQPIPTHAPPALPLLKKVPLTLQEWDPVAVWSSWLCLQRHWALQDLGSKVARLLSQNSPTSSGRDGMKQNMRQRHWPMLQGTDMSVKRVRPALDRAWSSHVNVSPKPTHTHTCSHTSQHMTEDSYPSHLR